MKLASVVVFYNPSDDNIKKIDVIKKVVDKLYIVDNTDDDLDRIKDDNKIEYINLKENKGIAYALNEGAKKAIKDGYQFLLTLDQDTNITEDVIKCMKEYLDKNDTKEIGLVSHYHDKGEDDDLPHGDVEEMIEVMTSGNIINLDAYKKIGGFKDWLFIDGVDTEYCLNLHKNGYKVIRLNKLVVKHNLGNKEVHKLFGKEFHCYNHNPIRRYYMVRNCLYINQMYSDLFPDHCSHLIQTQKGQAKRVLLFEKNKFNKLKMMYKGYKDFKRGIKGKLIK